MRQLILTSPNRFPPGQQAAYEADRDQALPLLRRLSALRPLGCAAADKERLHQFIVSVTTQYYGQGKSMAQLLVAGHNALADSLSRYAGRPKEFARFGVWWVRQGMQAVIDKNNIAEQSEI